MWFLFRSLVLIRLVPLLIIGVRVLVIEKVKENDNFECGFDSFNVRVLPVSIRFFIFCIIFLILDLELIILSLGPWVIRIRGIILNLIIFLVIITLRLLLEWLFGRLRWVE